MKQQYRRYAHHSHNGPKTLDTWIQRRCIICGRYLTKRQREYCAVHGSNNACNKRAYYKKKEANFLTEENLEEKGIPSSVIQDEEDDEL